MDQLKHRLAVRFETSVTNPDGTEHVLSKGHNLILDGGMDMPNLVSFGNCTRFCAIGTGTKPTSRASGAITFSRVGATVTASAGFFVVDDAGRVLKLNTGEKWRIVTYTDASTVDVATMPNPDAPTDGTTKGTVWYVNETSHQTETARTGNFIAYLSSFLVDTWTHSRTFVFPAAGVATVIKEIGWSPSGGGGAALYGRALVPGAGDAVGVGQVYKVKVSNLVTYSDATVANTFSSGTFDASGDSKMEFPFAAVISNTGDTLDEGYPGRTIEPCQVTLRIWMDTSTAALQPLNGATGQALNTGNLYTGDVGGWDAYVGGAWNKTYRVHFGPNSFNFSTLRSLAIATVMRGQACFRTLFAAPQTVDLDHSLEFTWLFSWERNLPN